MKTASARPRIGWSQIHFWLSVIVGLQVLIWIGTGAFFALNPIDQVRGAHLRQDQAPAAIDFRAVAITPEQAAGMFGLSAADIRLRMVAGRAAYLVSDGNQPLGLVDAATGQARPAITQEEARAVALGAWAGQGALNGVAYFAEGPPEYRREGAVWAARFDAPGAPVFYIEAATGEVRAVRTSQWRWFDLMWGFHIMDWDGREDINNAVLIMFSLIALAFSVSGLALTWGGVVRRSQSRRP
jgi:PepSY-associated TM region